MFTTKIEKVNVAGKSKKETDTEVAANNLIFNTHIYGTVTKNFIF